jgi:hypothetical protein
MKHQSKQNGNDDADQVFVLDLKTEFHLSSGASCTAARHNSGPRGAPLYTAAPRDRRLGHISNTPNPANYMQFAICALAATPTPKDL